MNQVRELIMAIGDPGTGKSLGGLTIAAANPNKLFHYLIADRYPAKLYEHFGGEQLPNVLEYESFDFATAAHNIAEVAHTARDNPLEHWVIVDTIGQLYKAAADAYTLERFNKTASDIIESRTIDYRTRQMYKQPENPETKGLYAGFAGWEWQLISTRFYNEIVFPLLRYSKVNVYMVAHPAALRGAGPNGQFIRSVPEIAGIKSRFETVGCVPDLHKQVVRYVDTILYFSRDGGSNSHYLYTIKETGKRNWLNEDTVFGSFWTDYQRLVMNHG